MRNYAGLICLCGLMLVGRTSLAQQTKGVKVPDGLVGGAALDNKIFDNKAFDKKVFDKKVKMTCPGLAVGELLEQLSAKTGIQLQADKTVADEKVVLFCPARPLKDTLNDLAALFNDVWRHSKTSDGKDRYLLLRTRASTLYEESLSRATYARLIAKLDEQVKALSE